MAKKTRQTGGGKKPHPLKGIKKRETVKVYPVDKAFLIFKHGGLTAALDHLCKGDEYAIYLQQQVDKLVKK